MATPFTELVLSVVSSCFRSPLRLGQLRGQRIVDNIEPGALRQQPTRDPVILRRCRRKQQATRILVNPEHDQGSLFFAQRDPLFHQSCAQQGGGGAASGNLSTGRGDAFVRHRVVVIDVNFQGGAIQNLGEAADAAALLAINNEQARD